MKINYWYKNIIINENTVEFKPKKIILIISLVKIILWLTSQVATVGTGEVKKILKTEPLSEIKLGYKPNLISSKNN